MLKEWVEFYLRTKTCKGFLACVPLFQQLYWEDMDGAF